MVLRASRSHTGAGGILMYAIVQTGGKQYRAEKDAILVVEKLDGEPGGKIELDQVVLVQDGKKIKIGSPYVPGAKVKTEIVRQTRGKKIIGFKYKAKKNVRKRWGHRQSETHLRVLAVVGGK